MKKLNILCKVVTLCMCLSFSGMLIPLISCAKEAETLVEPRMVYISGYSAELSISSNGLATIKGEVRGKTGEYYPEGYSGYIYPVRPGTAEWSRLANHQEMVDACEIPADILNSMSAEELAETILAYPLITDMFAYDDWNKGLTIVTEHFNGLEAFSKMADSASALTRLYVEQKAISNISSLTLDNTTTEMGCATRNQLLRSMVLSVLLTSDYYVDKMDSSDWAMLQGVSDEVEVAAVNAEFVRYEPTRSGTIKFVKTPMNSSVEALTTVCAEIWRNSAGELYIENLLSDYPTEYLDVLDNNYYDTYGIEPITEPTVKYNCHSYAWYNQSNSNPYWINDPSKYLTDGSYSEVGKIETAVGDRMVYYSSTDDSYAEITHSAIITSYTDYPKAKRTFVVKSKWGGAGLYEHSWDNCPYYYENKFPVDLKYFH